MFAPLFNRRSLLALLASTVSLPFWAVSGARADGAAVEVIVLADIHSAYERMAQILAAVEKQVSEARDRALVVINGDIFELGNSIAKNSGGEIDWAFLEAIAKLAPTVVNIGNHEADFDHEMANFVTRARKAGISVISNIIDRRTQKPFTEASATLTVAGKKIVLAGIATSSINTYPKATRETLDIPEPAEWAKANLADIFATGDIHIAVSHAGVVADKKILPLLPDASLLIGGHDHLDFIHAEGATRYIHTGSWGAVMTVASFGAGGVLTARRVPIATDAPASPTLEKLISDTTEKYLTPEEREIIGHIENPMSTNEAARFVASVIARKVGADIGFIGHTSFGAGLPRGDISRHAFNACLRFDGKLMMAEVDAATLASIIGVSDQDADIPLQSRTGDYLHSAHIDLPAAASYRLVCNDWSSMNQKTYFGREDLVFSEVPDIRLKQTVIEALKV